MPKAQTQSITVPIYKKGDKTNSCKILYPTLFSQGELHTYM
jgi:hypothetical protein